MFQVNLELSSKLYTYMYGIWTYVCGGVYMQRLYYSLPCSLRQGFSLKLSLVLWPISPREPPASTLHRTRVIDANVSKSSLFCKCLGLKYLFGSSWLCKEYSQPLTHLLGPESSRLLRKSSPELVEVKEAVYFHF